MCIHLLRTKINTRAVISHRDHLHGYCKVFTQRRAPNPFAGTRGSVLEVLSSGTEREMWRSWVDGASVGVQETEMGRCGHKEMRMKEKDVCVCL